MEQIILEIKIIRRTDETLSAEIRSRATKLIIFIKTYLISTENLLTRNHLIKNAPFLLF